MTSLHSGQSILHYRVIDRIGRGGMGEVYKAEDLKLRRHVAIKVLPLAVTHDETARRRLFREARSASALSHPNIVTIHSMFMLLHDHFGLGMALGNLGRVSEALQILHEAIEIARRNGNHFFLPRLPNCVGWIHRELQDFDQAIVHDQSGVEIAREDHVLEAEANSWINLGYDYTVEGARDKALAAFQQGETIYGQDDWFRWRYNIRCQAGQAEYWLAQNHLERAEGYARSLLEEATRFEAHKYVAIARKLLGQVAMARGDWHTAESEINLAVGVLRQFPAPLAAWKTYAVLGCLRLRTNEPQAARDAFAEAAAVVRQIASNVSDERLRDTFLNSLAVREVVEGAAGNDRSDSLLS